MEAQVDEQVPKKARPALDREGVHQTDFTASKGNALQACIATVLGLTLEDIPNFMLLPGDMYVNVRCFLSNFDLGFMKIMLDANGRLPFAPGANKTIVLLA